MQDPGRRHPIHLHARGGAGDSVFVFVTICTKGRQPLLACEALHALLSEVWRESSRWRVGRYVILPDHLHFFCTEAPENQTPLESWIRFWKSTVSRKWNQSTGTKADLWERHFWDRQLRSGESYSQKWDYVRNNTVRHGYAKQPEDWPYQGEIHDLQW